MKINYKHLQNSQEEWDAAIGLHGKPVEETVILHYDWNNIDGEWPSLVLAFSNQHRFH